MVKTEEQNEHETRDRITELSTELKLLILSSLPLKDAIAISCASTIWRHTWVSLTAFDFGPTFVNSSSTLSQTLLNDLDNSHRLYQFGLICDVGCMMLLLDRLFQIYVENRQPRHVLKKLFFYVPFLSTTDANIRDFGLDVVSRWLSLVKDDIEELRYHVFTSPCCNVIFQCKRLTKLELMRCNLTYIGPSFGLPCLKQLTMLEMNVGNDTLDFLLHNCLALEELELWDVKGPKALRIPVFTKLKNVKVAHISNLDQVEIDARSLRCLGLVNLETNTGEVKVSYHSRKNLEELFVDHCGISDKFFNHVTEFPRLKNLFITNCSELKRIKIKSDCLARFCVHECSNLSQIELDAPKLLFFEYSITGNNDFISLLSKCHADHVSLFFGPRNVAYDCISRQSKLLALLANFRNSKYVSITIFFKKDLIFSQELRERFSPPFSEVQDLSVTVATCEPTHDVLQYLDNLLWLSFQPRKISIDCKYQSKLSVELQWEGRGCRRPILKEFSIVDLAGLDDAAATSIEKLLDDARKISDDV